MRRGQQHQQYEIDSFWRWFMDHDAIIKGLYASESRKELMRLLSPRIKQLHEGLAWEIGPGKSATYAFTLSPNRSATLLRITETIVSRSPRLDEWEFYSARPKKDWAFRVELTNQRGQSVMLDASKWKYCLTGYAGQSFFDIMLVAIDLPRLDEAACQQAASLVLESILGERKMIERIGHIKIISHVDQETEERLTEIGFLDQHLDSLASG